MDSKNEKQQVQLPPNDLATFDYVSTRFDAMVQKGVRPEDLLAPAFWAHHGVKMKPMDEVRVRAEDGTWVAYLLVLDCSRTWAKMKQLALHQLGTADVSLTQASEAEVKAFIDAHEVKHRGPLKWSVVRTSDRAVLAEGIAQREEARSWLEKHAREQVGGPAKARTEPVTA